MGIYDIVEQSHNTDSSQLFLKLFDQSERFQKVLPHMDHASLLRILHKMLDDKVLKQYLDQVPRDPRLDYSLRAMHESDLSCKLFAEQLFRPLELFQQVVHHADDASICEIVEQMDSSKVTVVKCLCAKKDNGNTLLHIAALQNRPQLC